MSKKEKKRAFCEECGLSANHHFHTWTESIIEATLPNILPKGFENLVGSVFESLLSLLKVVRYEKNFEPELLPLKSRVLLEEAKSRGLNAALQKGPYGYTGNIKLRTDWEKNFTFRWLPLTNSSKFNIDDKNQVKRVLKKEGFPYVQGKSFWFFQKRRANLFAKEAGFPLVVKPRSGSVARHVATNIKSLDELEKAIHSVNKYSSRFIVEKYIPDSWVYRATVVGNQVFCVKQIPANIVGDGVSTIEELVEKKNTDPKRDIGTKTDRLYHDIKYSVNPNLILKRGGIVYLQKDPFMKFGGELEEVTGTIHPDNLKLFRDIAKHLDLKLVGMDFIAKDISIPWNEQPCAILELNSLPCIELHHFPTKGTQRM